ncbi:MAG: alpha-2-macroglobulin family protein, partial [Methylobacteriaceae bacterium]|nr:alpha-2-macroglobulin family protein [Methylobacteriaceae bacterium]
MFRRFLRAVFVVVAVCIPASAFAWPDYVDRNLETSGETLSGELKTRLPASEKRSAAELAALAQAALNADDPEMASLFYARAVAKAPDNGDVWLGFSLAQQQLRQRRPDFGWWLGRNAKTSAYMTLKLATTPKQAAMAFFTLGNAYAGDGEWPQALSHYRSSLALEENAALRAAYDKLALQYGFRATGFNTYQPDGTSPRVCLNFDGDRPSMNGAIDWSDYVVVRGAADYSVQVEDGQLCVTGLKTASVYTVTLRRGLPGENGGVLPKEFTYTVEIPGSEPSIRFTGMNYVLPKTGRQGIPVVSRNMSAAAVSILRVGERSLTNVMSVSENGFLSQISEYVHVQLRDRQAVRVWHGTLFIDNKPETDVVTSFPVDEVIRGFQPGVYVMVAAPLKDNGGLQAVVDDSTDLWEYESTMLATQWFIVSDIGITAFSGGGGISVAVNALGSAKPMAGAKVTLLAANNEILAERQTGADGFVTFDPGLSRADGGMKPRIAVVSSETDYAFLDLSAAAFDLTDRGVRGGEPLGAQNAFIYTERGVYRPGESVFITALLRDARGLAIPETPLTLKVFRPDGVEYRSLLTADQGEGGRVATIPLLSGVARGAWRVSAYTDPNLPPVGTAGFAVEDYVPERLKMSILPRETRLKAGEAAAFAVHADYLYGAPGADLAVAGKIDVSAASGYPGYDGYLFGRQDEKVETVSLSMDEPGRTDDKGDAEAALTVPEVVSTRPMQATVRFDVSEDGGRAVSDTVVLPVLPKGAAVGVKPRFKGNRADPATLAGFDIVLLDETLQPLAGRSLTWTLSVVHRDYQWYLSGGRWVHESSKRLETVDEGAVETGADGRSLLNAAVAGERRYALTLRTAGGEDDAPVVTVYEFATGWFADAQADSPDMLELAVDKTDYAAGDVMTVRLTPRTASEVLLAVVSDKVYPLRSLWVESAGTHVDIPVSGEWGTGAYLVALAHRPLDADAGRQPGRAVGLVWFSIGKSARVLDVAVAAEAVVRPSGPVTVAVETRGLEPGVKSFVTLALVDNGILNLTGFKTPDPLGHFYGQRRIGADIRDLYGFLIDGSQGGKGAVRFGGDEGAPGVPQPGLTQDPLIRFSGLIEADAGGRATVSFVLPAFNGSARIMAVAWTKDRVGAVERELTIRDRVVMAGTLPRFLTVGDSTQFTDVLHNVDGAAGDYTLNLAVSGPLKMDEAALNRTLRLDAGGKEVLRVPIGGVGVGEARIEATLTGPDAFETRQSFRLAVVPGSPARFSTEEITLKPERGWSATAGLTSGLLPGTGMVTVMAAPEGVPDIPALLARLERYPYGCTEQTTSRALPLLYIDELTGAAAADADNDAGERVRAAVQRILSRRLSDGSIGLWDARYRADLWTNAYAADFLTRAAEKQYDVPRPAMDRLLGYL